MTRSLAIVCAIVLAALSALAIAGNAAASSSGKGASTTTATAPAAPAWQTAWSSPMDLTLGTAYDATARDIAAVSVPGTSLKFQFSNMWSSTPTTFGAVTVGIQQSGAAVVPGSFVPVTFNGGSRAVTIPAGGRATSDPVAMTVKAGEAMAVSLSVSGSATVSVHFCCEGRIDSYATANGVSDQSTNPAASAFVLGDSNIRWLSAISVSGTQSLGTVVAFGDSITEGFNNTGFGWPDALQARIAQLPPSRQVALANEGIAGNTLTAFPPGTTYAESSGGLPGVTRLGPDALTLPGVKDVILFLGTNDIWFGAGGEDTARPLPPYGTAPAIEAAMTAVIAQTHAAGIKIFGVTLLPRSSFIGDHDEKPETWSPTDQATLAAVNAWILTPGNGFDGTIDLAAVMGDVYNGACLPDTPFAPYYTVDNLHPNTAGQTVMADAIPTSMLGMPAAPQVPQLLAVAPTPGCPAATTAEHVLALGGSVAASSPTTTSPSSTTTRPTPPQPATHAGRSGSTPTSYLLGLGALIVAGTGSLLLIMRRRKRRRRWQHRALDRRYPLRTPVAPSPPGASSPGGRNQLSANRGSPSAARRDPFPVEGTGTGGSAPRSG